MTLNYILGALLAGAMLWAVCVYFGNRFGLWPTLGNKIIALGVIMFCVFVIMLWAGVISR